MTQLVKSVLSVWCTLKSDRSQHWVCLLFRGAYCAATVARLTGVATTEMFDGTAEWIVRCVTFAVFLIHSHAWPTCIITVCSLLTSCHVTICRHIVWIRYGLMAPLLCLVFYCCIYTVGIKWVISASLICPYFLSTSRHWPVTIWCLKDLLEKLWLLKLLMVSDVLISLWKRVVISLYCSFVCTGGHRLTRTCGRSRRFCMNKKCKLLSQQLK